MHKQKVLECPQHIKQYRSNKKSIGIDYGIIRTIKWLWENRIDTLGCCCGKGKKFTGRPNVVLHESYTDADIEYIRTLIKKVDKRNWMLTQWRHIEIKKTNKSQRPFFVGKDKLFSLPF